MKELDAVYVAGLFDGEGTVDVSVDKRDGFSIAMSLIIAMTDGDVIHWLQSVAGGSVSPKKTYQKHHRPQYQWKISGVRATELAAVLVPYSKTKSAQLRAFIQLGKLRAGFIKGRAGKWIDPGTIPQRFALVELIHQLNRGQTNEMLRGGLRCASPDEENVDYS